MRTFNSAKFNRRYYRKFQIEKYGASYRVIICDYKVNPLGFVISFSTNPERPVRLKDFIVAKNLLTRRIKTLNSWSMN